MWDGDFETVCSRFSRFCILGHIDQDERGHHMKKLILLVFCMTLFSTTSWADYQCKICGEYKGEKACSEASGTTEATAKESAQNNLYEAMLAKNPTNLECYPTYEQCGKACPKKRRNSIPGKPQPVVDPQHKKCMDNCRISRIKCESREKKIVENKTKDIPKKTKIESTTCSEKK